MSFQIILVQINLSLVNFTQIVITSTSDMNASELNFNRNGMKSFQFFVSNKFAKLLQTCFCLDHGD